MSENLEDRLKFILDDLPDQLLSDRYRRRLLKVGKLLPTLEHGIIELQEYPLNPRVDLMMCVFQKEVEKSFFEKNNPSKRNSFLGHPDQNFDDFLSEWNSSGNYLTSLLNNIYLVYDLEDHNDEVPYPWRYLAFKKIALGTDLWMTIFLKSMETFAFQTNKKALLLLEKCFDNLTTNSWIFGYGFLYSRHQKSLRIGVAGFLSVREIAEFLTKIEWRGSIPQISDTISFSDLYVEDYVLALDLGENISSTIGIECNISKTDNVEKSEAFLDRIEADFPYDKDRKSKLIKWIGKYEFTPAAGEIVDCNRWLNHVKFTFADNRVSKIKPYLYFEFKNK